MTTLPEDIANELQSLKLETPLRDACDALMRWQFGVENHVEDFWTKECGWTKRPTVSWMCGSFAGDMALGGPCDEDGKEWRVFGPGPIWHTGQAMKALLKARAHAVQVERIDRAVVQGAAYLLRLQILEGRHRGAFWCPPHSLPPAWLARSPDLTVYMMPGKWEKPKDQILNSDMSEAMEGFLMGADFLSDSVLLEACRLWGDWLARESNYKPGHYHHWFYADGTKKELVRFWQPDDGVQGLLAVRFKNDDWLKRYQDGVRRCIEWRIDLQEYPSQQARSFYWNASFMFPVIDGRVPGERERATEKLIEYTKWLIGLVQPDGMTEFRYKEGGFPQGYGLCSGDGAATAMLIRMCLMLWRNTGDRQWLDSALPPTRWLVKNQYRAPEDGAVAGGFPMVRWMKTAPEGKPFQFKRSISTIFSIMALSEWLSILRKGES